MTDISGIFDIVTGNPFVGIAIGLGMVISLLLTESVGVTAGGLIAPGYIALSLHNPMAVIITFVISLITLLIVHLLSMKIIIYGKRRLVFCILIAFIIVVRILAQRDCHVRTSYLFLVPIKFQSYFGDIFVDN